jgi:SHS2 domain-containing protein
MNQFCLLEHTADMGIAAEGETLAALFQQAALGLRQILTSCTDIHARQEIIVEIQGQDRGELLVNWLSELLYLLESRQFLPASFQIDDISDQQVRARVRGEMLVPGRHCLDREIKAVTYHQLLVEQTADGWQAQVFVDL